MRIINFILKNKRAVVTELCFLAVFLLLPMVYIHNLRCNYYDEILDYKGKVEGKIVKFRQPEIRGKKISFSLADIDDLSFEPASTPPVTGVKEGDIVWVSGIIESMDSLSIPIRNSDGEEVRNMNFKALNAHYIEMEVKSTKGGGHIEKMTYERRFTADAAKIGAMPSS